MDVTVSLAPNVFVEDLGDEMVVLIGAKSEMLRLTGKSVDIIRTLTSGPSRYVQSDTIKSLIDRGVIRPSAFTRRHLVTAGIAGAGAGIALLSLPTVAAAASPAPSGGSGSGSGDIQYFRELGWRLGSIEIVLRNVAATPDSTGSLTISSESGGPFVMNLLSFSSGIAEFRSADTNFSNPPSGTSFTFSWRVNGVSYSFTTTT